MKTAFETKTRGQVHCPICTHTVEAEVENFGRRTRVIPGQRCVRCSAKLDAAMVVEVLRAA